MAIDLVLNDVQAAALRPPSLTVSDSAASGPAAPAAPPPASKPPSRPDDAVTLEINGQRFTGWTDVRIVRGIEVFPAHAVLSVTERLPGQSGLLSIDPGQTCRVRIGGDLVISGYVDTYDAQVGVKEHRITIAVRSGTEDLVDCAAGVADGQEGHATMTFSAPTLLQLAQDLCKPFGIAVTAPDGEGGPLVSTGDGIPQFTISLNQSVYEVIEPRARWKSMLPMDGVDGNLVLAKLGSRKAASGFTLPGSVMQARAGFRKQDRFTVYLPALFALDQAFEVGAAAGAGSGNFLLPVRDEAAFAGQPRLDGGTRYRPRFVVSDQQISGLRLAEVLAGWEKARRYGRSQAVTATVALWRDSAGTLWEPNTLAPVDMPALKLPTLEWVIAEVAYLRGAEGTRSVVTLMPKEAFLPQPTFVTAYDPQVSQATQQAMSASSRQILADSSRSVTNPGAGANGNPRAGDAPGL